MSPSVKQSAKTPPSHAKYPHAVAAPVASSRARTTGAIPLTSTSQKRKMRIPVAPAFKSARIREDVLRSLPSGSPRKTAHPAIAPRARIAVMVIAGRPPADAILGVASRSLGALDHLKEA